MVVLGGVVLVVAGAACGERADFAQDVTFADIEDAITDGGLAICETGTDPDGQANQAVASRQYEVGFECPSDDIVPVVVDEFDDEEDRDAAARTFEVQVRPRGYGAVWTYGPVTIHTFGERDDAVEERLTEIFDDLGAE